MSTRQGTCKRRNFLNALIWGSAGMLAVSDVKKLEAQAADKPNFVLIFADDMGYGDLSLGATPNLDRMAKEGAVLKNFYVPTPYCAPSRATILTGRYPFRHGVVFNPTPDVGQNETGLSDSEITIAEALKEKGYTSTCIGKWHLGHIEKYLPRKHGFDEYFGILYSNDMRPVQLVENEKVVEYPVLQANLTKRYTNRAIDFIRRARKKKKPFFLYLPHAMPHKPLAPSEEFYTPDTPKDLYADVVRELDWSVGRILNEIKKQGIEKNTFVIFTSDNGPHYGGSTGGLRGRKHRTWEGGLRVPMITRWPGRIPKGVTNKGIAGTIDIFPTFLKLADIPLPKDRKLDGRDIMPLLKSESAKSPHEAIFAMQGTKLMLVRSGKWKLHVHPSRQEPKKRKKPWKDFRGPDGVTILAPFEQYTPDDYPGVKTGVRSKKMMLFDLEKDPSEQHDISAKHPEIVKKLKALYDKANSEVPKFKRPKRLYKKLQRIKGGDFKYKP